MLAPQLPGYAVPRYVCEATGPAGEDTGCCDPRPAHRRTWRPVRRSELVAQQYGSCGKPPATPSAPRPAAIFMRSPRCRLARYSRYRAGDVQPSSISRYLDQMSHASVGVNSAPTRELDIVSDRFSDVRHDLRPLPTEVKQRPRAANRDRHAEGEQNAILNGPGGAFPSGVSLSLACRQGRISRIVGTTNSRLQAHRTVSTGLGGTYADGLSAFAREEKSADS